ncbi:ABC transporter permease [Pseudochrobactrum sp. HB0163]|uniref:ABC transporter permease n=1 Tax=Pseudochrobactrum sp. HB0163 TaxID=3450708 RepID=UPI003F6E1343
MSFDFFIQSFMAMAAGIPLTLKLASSAIALGACLALLIAMMRLSGIAVLDWIARIYIFIFRGTPLLVQIFIIYYGLSQFPVIRYSFLWPVLREAYWCAIIALTMNTAAYAGEIIRGGLLSVPHGQVEAAKACGMSRFTCFRRIIMPLAIRQALPAYGNEMISMVKATSLASIITLMEVTGIAAKLIAESYRAIEIFIVAGAIYLIINFVLTRLLLLAEYRLTPYLRQPVPADIALAGVKAPTGGKSS